MTHGGAVLGAQTLGPDLKRCISDHLSVIQTLVWAPGCQPLFYQTSEQFMTAANASKISAAQILLFFHLRSPHRQNEDFSCKNFFHQRDILWLCLVSVRTYISMQVLKLAYAKTAVWSCHFLMGVLSFCTLDTYCWQFCIMMINVFQAGNLALLSGQQAAQCVVAVLPQDPIPFFTSKQGTSALPVYFASAYFPLTVGSFLLQESCIGAWTGWYMQPMQRYKK